MLGWRNIILGKPFSRLTDKLTKKLFDRFYSRCPQASWDLWSSTELSWFVGSFGDIEVSWIGGGAFWADRNFQRYLCEPSRGGEGLLTTGVCSRLLALSRWSASQQLPRSEVIWLWTTKVPFRRRWIEAPNTSQKKMLDSQPNNLATKNYWKRSKEFFFRFTLVVDCGAEVGMFCVSVFATKN